MSDKLSNICSNDHQLQSNSGATATAVDMITKACGAGDETAKMQILNWASDGENLINLRNKIKDSAKHSTLKQEVTMNELPAEMSITLTEIDHEILRCLNAKLINYFGEDVNKYISNYPLFLEQFKEEIGAIVKNKIGNAL
jgi:hypothetical protein